MGRTARLNPATGRFAKLPPETRAELEARFWSFVDKSAGPDGCWLWTGAINIDGYGHFRLNGTVARAPRVAYALVKGPIEDRRIIMHECDNRRCCNPAHLTAGTHHQNNLALWARGHRGRKKPTPLRLEFD